MKILFLYRSARKQRYFTAVAEEVRRRHGHECACDIVGYWTLIRKAGRSAVPVPCSTQWHGLIERIEQQLFHAKTGSLEDYKRQILRPVLKVLSDQLYRGLFRYLSREKPDVVVLWNGSKAEDAVFHLVNRHFDIPVEYFENGLLPGTTTMDPVGINAGNSVPRVLEAFSTQPAWLQMERAFDGRAYRRGAGIHSIGSVPRRHVLVPFQLDRDTQILDHAIWTHSMYELFDALDRSTEALLRQNLHVVFREHPDSRCRYTELHRRAAHHPCLHFDSRTPLQAAIDDSMAVITINSTVGLQAMLRGKPVAVLGRACYGIEGLVNTVMSQGELIDFIDDLGLGKVTVDQAARNRYLNYLHGEYLLQGDWREPDERHLREVATRLLYRRSANTGKVIQPCEVVAPDRVATLQFQGQGYL